MSTSIIWLSLLLGAGLSAAAILAATAPRDAEELNETAAILQRCLNEFGTPASNVSYRQQLARFAQWGEHEEVPCFTRCLVAAKGWFDLATNRWHKQQLVDALGADMYNYCRYELDRTVEHACSFAHRGLRCLREAEVQLSVTYANLLHCVNDFGVSVTQMQRYALFPDAEVVPCLFRCFAERSEFYTPHHEWQLLNWVRAFGPMKYDEAATNECKTSAAQMLELSTCEWMYREYICIERLHYNTDGSVSTTTSMPIATSTLWSTTGELSTSPLDELLPTEETDHILF